MIQRLSFCKKRLRKKSKKKLQMMVTRTNSLPRTLMDNSKIRIKEARITLMKQILTLRRRRESILLRAMKRQMTPKKPLKTKTKKTLKN